MLCNKAKVGISLMPKTSTSVGKASERMNPTLDEADHHC